MGTKKDIGTVFKEALSGYSAQPDDVWGSIEAQLKKGRRRKLFFLWILCFLILTPSLFYIYKYNTPVPAPKTDNNQELVLGNPTENGIDLTFNNIDSTKAKVKDSITITDIKIAQSNIKTSNKKRELYSKPSSIKNPETETDSLYKRTQAMHSFAQMLPIKVDDLSFSSLNINELTSKTGSEDIKDVLDDDGNIFTRWSFSPYRSLDHYNAFNRKTNEQFTFNKGVFIQYRGTRNLAFRLGYKELNLQYIFQDVTTERQQKVSYTEIPLTLKYSLNNKSKIKPSIIVGTSFLFLDNATIFSEVNNITTINKGEFRQQLFSLNAGLGLQYSISKRWSFNLESTFKYHPYPYTKSVSFYPYTISITAGIEYHFKF